MAVIESYQDGTPSWIDLSTPDPDGAKDFYHALFGWEFEDNPAGDRGVYTMASKDGHAAAGMMEQASEQVEMGIPPFWNTYVTCREIDAAVAKVEEAGGSVMMPTMDVMDAGRMAVIVDPGGAVFSLWAPKEHIGCEVVNEHGALMWNELTSPAIDAAAPFYGELFGWQTETADMASGPYTMFMLGEQPIGGAQQPMEDSTPPHWGVVFAVEDCVATLEVVSANGGTVLFGPETMEIGTFGAVQDPQGAVFQVMEPAAE